MLDGENERSMHLVEVDEKVVEGFLGLFGAEVPEGLDGFDRLLCAVLLLHHDRHVLESALDPIPGIYCFPEPYYCCIQVLLHQLNEHMACIFIVLYMDSLIRKMTLFMDLIANDVAVHGLNQSYRSFECLITTTSP